MLLGLIVYAWHKADRAYYGVFIFMCSSMVLHSMGGVVFVFDEPVLTGSFYLSAVLVLMALLAAQFSVIEARSVLTAVLIGLVMVGIGYMRWGVMDHAGAMSLDPNAFLNARNSFLLVFKHLFSGTLLLALMAYLELHPLWRKLAVCLVIDMLVALPIGLLALHMVQPTLPGAVLFEVGVATFVARCALPIMFAGYLYWQDRKRSVSLATSV